jgi:FHS family L-fucose permease-like MFS transporter
MIGPLIGGLFVLGNNGANTSEGLASIKIVYVIIGTVIALVAISFSFVKVPATIEPHAAVKEGFTIEEVPAPSKKLFQLRHFVWAAVSQFFNVAAQAGTWAFFINYGHDIMGLPDKVASYWMSMFMGMMLLGRFVGTALMRFIAPNKLLAAFVAGNILMCIIVAQHLGWVSFIALLFINFFFGIMYPTIFSLGLKNLGTHTQQASSFISMGVCGGAFFPFFMGKIANHNVATAYYLPILCYVIIFLFAYKFYKVQKDIA